MIDWISSWAEAIIIAVIIATIIEMILPEGNSKKYIKVVIGVYILFTIISPVITKFTGKSLAVSDIIDLDKYIEEAKQSELAQNLLQEENSSNIRDIYINNLKSDIKSKLNSKGYSVESIELDVSDDEKYTLNKIKLSVNKEETNDEDTNTENNSSSIETVNEVSINISSDSNNTNNTQTSKTSEENKKNNLSNSDKNKIKQYLSSVYEINEKNIVVN